MKKSLVALTVILLISTVLSGCSKQPSSESSATQTNFDSTWESYKDDIVNCPYDTRWQIDKTKGLEDFSKKFFNVTAFRIAKSIHNTQKSVYHLMIDLSDYVS